MEPTTAKSRLAQWIGRREALLLGASTLFMLAMALVNTSALADWTVRSLWTTLWPNLAEPTPGRKPLESAAVYANATDWVAHAMDATLLVAALSTFWIGMRLAVIRRYGARAGDVGFDLFFDVLLLILIAMLLYKC